MGSSGPGPGTDRADEATVESGQGVHGRGVLVSVGDRVERYVVLDALGAGAMGAVYLAYDPSLDRQVALKLLHTDPAVEPTGPARMLREAQALAKLAHPNVVVVHEVGTSDDRIYIAMEHVPGETLLRWMGAPHSWREIVRVFVAAGEGLAAAHAAGLVHRDFKPANVLMGIDGSRPRVVDFGLARPPTSSEASDAPSAANSSAEVGSLTEAGMVVGTPRYMSPEQHQGQAGDAACDQFAFCATLFEALYGRAPFEGESMAELLIAKLGGNIVSVSRSGIPPRLRRLIARGLAPRPGNRFTSMRELLDQLRRTVTPRRMSGMLAVAGAVAVVGTGWAVVAAPRDPCGAGIDRARPVWNDATRESVVQALVTASPMLGEATSTRVQPRLDAYAQRWVAAHRDACEATQVRYEQSAEQMDRRMQCLDDQFRRLRALVGTLAQADDAVVRGAVRAVDGLAPPERCADAAYVAKQASPPPDSAVVPEVERLRNVLARADALGATGRYADAREAIAEIAADVAAVSYGPLQLEYAHAEAEFIALTGEYAEAESKLRDVLVGARREGAERFEAPAELTLVNVLHKLDRADEALELARLVAARAEHDGDTGLHARALERHGVILSIQGHHDDAIADLERSLELTESYAPDSVSLAAARQALVGAYYRAGKVVKAGDEQRLALEMSERLMGERHPTTIEARAGLSTFQYDTGELGLAIANIETTLEHARDVLGPRHPTTSNYLDMKASFIAASGKYEESLAILEDVLEIRSEAFGARSRQVARTLNNIAATQHDLDREDDAAQTLRQSLEIKREVLGAEHADTINAKINLGAFLAELGKTDEAAPLLEEALASQIALEGEHHPDVLAARANLARLRLDQERVADARLLTDTMIASANETLPPHHVMWAFVWRTDGMVATEEGRFDAAVAAHERELQAAIDAKQTADIERARAILDQSRARAAAR